MLRHTLIRRLIPMGKPLLSDVERKSVKERDGHFTSWGQRARCTVADCAPIAICGSRPAFVDPHDTLSGARAQPLCFHAPRKGGGTSCLFHGKLRKLTPCLPCHWTWKSIIQRNGTKALNYVFFKLCILMFQK